MLLTHETLKECLSNIDYSIKGEYPNKFIYTNENTNTFIRIWNETLEVNCHSGLRVTFVFEKTQIQMLSQETVMIGEENSFVNLYNFNLQVVS